MIISPSFCHDAIIGRLWCNNIWSLLEFSAILIIAWWGVNKAQKRL